MIFVLQYIPIAIQPNGRRWINGENVTLRRGLLTWNVKVVCSTGLPRFSAGWNQFTTNNELEKDDTLVFTFHQEDLIFDIVIE